MPSSFQITLLGSGSAGNCALLEAGDTRLLIDAGLNARQITLRLESLGVSPEQLSGILLTHEHSDHIGGLRVFCKRHQLPVYTTPLTLERLSQEHLKGYGHVQQFVDGSEFCIGAVGVQAFRVTHDAVDPVGFVLHYQGRKLGFLTDLGHCSHLVKERVRGVQTLVIETNYDEKLLQNDTRRPWPIKQRIISRHGHLSNKAAATMIGELVEHGLERALLGHLSRDCNTPELAIGTVLNHLTEVGGEAAAANIGLHCGSQHEVSPRFAIGVPPSAD